MKVLVLGGGNSKEREVSMWSSAAVRKALEELGHEVVAVDPADGTEMVRKAAAECDVVLPILHGVGGEDGKIQRILDETRVPYLGSGVAASELGMDKARFKELMRQHKVLTPASEVVTAETFARSSLAKAPFVLKPVDGGSSVDMMIVRHLPYDAAQAKELLASYGHMLLEELIEGVEITVPVLGNAALPVIEIVPPEGQEFDYENKYSGATAELCPPKHVSEIAQRQAQALAERVHQLVGARHLSRTDMFVDRDGRIYVLEINTMPGMTEQSLLPRSAAVAGLSWNQLVARLVELTTSRER